MATEMTTTTTPNTTLSIPTDLTQETKPQNPDGLVVVVLEVVLVLVVAIAFFFCCCQASILDSVGLVCLSDTNQCGALLDQKPPCDITQISTCRAIVLSLWTSQANKHTYYNLLVLPS